MKSKTDFFQAIEALLPEIPVPVKFIDRVDLNEITLPEMRKEWKALSRLKADLLDPYHQHMSGYTKETWTLMLGDEDMPETIKYKEYISEIQKTIRKTCKIVKLKRGKKNG